MILPATNGVHKDVDDLYGDQFTVALARAASALECAPYWHSGEKAPSRLARAQELVRHSRVILQDERLAIVHGSTKAYDVTGFHCTCPQSQKGQSSWCVHAVAVKLARTLDNPPREAASVALGTLRTGTLPLPPVTVDERLAQPVPDLPLIAHREEGPVYTASDGTRYTLESRPYFPPSTPEGEGRPEDHRVALGTMHDSTQLQMHHTPQEDRMADEYIPEPIDLDHVTTAVLDASDADFPPMGQTATSALRPRTPQVDDLEAALQVWTTERAVVQRFLKQELRANVDYYTLRIGGKDSKPSLSKAGAEKVLGWLKIQASFTPDTGTWEMLGRPTDLVCYVCTLRTRSGEIVGEGRGARSLKKDSGDINKAMKMAEKSAMVSAVLRTGALSDVFTQDLEDMQEEPAKVAKPNPLHPSADLRQRIWAKVQELAPDVKTRDAVEAWLTKRTGLDLHPDNYAQILGQLTAGEGR